MTERVLPGIGLTGYWDQGAPWKVGGDQNWLKSSVLTQLAVESMTTSLPASPLNGVIYIVPAADANGNQVAARDNGAWVFMPPQEGWNAYVRDIDTLMNFNGSTWVPSTAPLAAMLIAPTGSANIGFQQAGVDTVYRTLESKARDIVSVKDYGATGLGILDDAPAINKCIAANPGKTIYFPPGVYRVSQVNVSTGVNMLGSGIGSTYILLGTFAPLDADAVRYTLTSEARNLFFRGITVGNFGSTVGRSGHGLNISNAPLLNFSIDNNNLGAAGETGWGLYSSSRGLGGGTVYNNTIPGNIYLRQSTDGLVAAKNTIFGGRGWGVDIEVEVGSYCTAFRDNLIVCQNGGMAIQDGSQIIVENNQFEQPSGTVNSTPLSAHVAVVNASGNINRTRNILFKKNNFGGGTGIGRDMWILSGSNITLEDNRFNKGSGAHIAINAAAVNTLLLRNSFDVAGVPVTSGAQISIANSSTSTMWDAWRDGNVDLGYSDGYPSPLYGRQLKFRAMGTTTASFVLANDSGSFVAYTAAGKAVLESGGGMSMRGSTNPAQTFELDTSGRMVPGVDNSQALGTAAARYSALYATVVRFGAGTAGLFGGSGTPEGVVTAPVGSLFTRTDGGASTTLYVKESGAGNTGWVAK